MAWLGLTQRQETHQEAHLIRGGSGLHSGLNVAPQRTSEQGGT